MSIQVKTCQFCGGDASRLDPNPVAGRIVFTTCCNNHGCLVLPFVTGPSRKAADTFWNDRATETLTSNPTLEWHERMDGDFVAESAFGWIYRIADFYPGSTTLFILESYPVNLALKWVHESLEAAKSYAQEDYDLRVLAANKKRTAADSKYRLLMEGDVIQIGDEGLAPDCVTWTVLDKSSFIVDCTYGPGKFTPIRRLISEKEEAS